ncbi:MAG: hypothetical protein ACE5FH_12195 [Candidatus Zixiibacteriota bacterium]
MKKTCMTLLLITLALVLAIGCGGDSTDDGGGLGTKPDPLKRVIAGTLASPDMNSVDHAAWVALDSTVLSLSSGTRPAKIAPPAASGVPADLTVKAINNNGMLFVRLQWVDASHSVWPDRWKVVGTPPPVNFSRDTTAFKEDQALLLFDIEGSAQRDAWNWRVVTTGGAGLAEDMSFLSPELTVDTDTIGVHAVFDNSILGLQPQKMHINGSSFKGYILKSSETTDASSVSPGWVQDQFLAGWIVDDALAGNPTRRGSRWDIDAVSAYDSSAATMYTVVLARQLNTGHAEDADLSTVDSVKMQIGLVDNRGEFAFTGGGSFQGFTDEFWLILR